MCKKCDARAELLFCLLNLMFRDTVASLDLKVPIDVVELTIHRVYQVLNDRTGMRYRKQCLQDLHTRLSPAPSRCSRNFSRCAFPTISEPGTGCTWFCKTSYVIESTILVTNLETLVWFSPSPMLIWVLQSSQCSKIRVAQHWGRRETHLSENEGVRSECKKFGENSRQMAPVSTICGEYCRLSAGPS